MPQSRMFSPLGTLTRSCLIRPIRNSCWSGAPPRPRCSASRCCCSHTIDLEEPKAVQWKKSCLVSKGKRKGEERVSSSAQGGREAAESTRGSCIWVTSLLVIFLLRKCSGAAPCGRWMYSWRTSCSTSSMEQPVPPGRGSWGREEHLLLLPLPVLPVHHHVGWLPHPPHPVGLGAEGG